MINTYKPRFKPWRYIPAAAAVPALILAAFMLYGGRTAFAQDGPAAADPASLAPTAPADMSRPDVLLVTQKLSDFPKDMLRQPLLKVFFTKDFVSYYESGESALSLKGAMRRLAFEQHTTVLDKLYSYALNAPAELAFWKSFNGRLEQYMLVLSRPKLAALLGFLAKIAADDKQLSVYKQLQVPRLGNVTVFKLAYGYGCSLYFAGLGDKLVVYSSPDMTLPAPDELARWDDRARAEFGRSKGSGTFSRVYGPETGKAKHVLYASASFFSFGYQNFFPALAALKFRYAGEAWETYSLTGSHGAKSAIKAGPLWDSVPKSPALCAALPLDADKAADLLTALGNGDAEKKGLRSLAKTLRGPAGLCWYPGSAVYTPLLVMRTGQAVPAAAARALFEKAVGGNEAGILTGEQAETEEGGGPPHAARFEAPFPVDVKQLKDGFLLTREVSSRFGLYDQSQSPRGAKMRSRKFFRVSMLRSGEWLFFSADDRLVDKAMSVRQKRYPALSDQLNASQRQGGLIVFPGGAAELAKSAVLQSLPAEQESVFRESVSRLLFPAFERIGRFPGYSLAMPDYGSARPLKWERLRWQDIWLK